MLHDVDVVEDVAISRGYNLFAPVMPSQFTVGGVSRLEDLANKVRDLMVGMGFQEMIANIMGHAMTFAPACGSTGPSGHASSRSIMS